MLADIAADGVAVLHLAFILFVVLGGIAVFWWPRLMYLHLPALAWGVFVEFSGRICPLTPLEQSLRREAGQQGYTGGFIDNYILPIIYPPGLERPTQWMLGLAVLAINIAVYGLLIRRGRQIRR